MNWGQSGTTGGVVGTHQLQEKTQDDSKPPPQHHHSAWTEAKRWELVVKFEGVCVCAHGHEDSEVGELRLQKEVG